MKLKSRWSSGGPAEERRGTPRQPTRSRAKKKKKLNCLTEINRQTLMLGFSIQPKRRLAYRSNGRTTQIIRESPATSRPSMERSDQEARFHRRPFEMARIACQEIGRAPRRA